MAGILNSSRIRSDFDRIREEFGEAVTGGAEMSIARGNDARCCPAPNGAVVARSGGCERRERAASRDRDVALPRVIAGPVVRRVESTSCSFWVVLREAATVTAKIWKGHQTAPVADSVPLVAAGELATRAIGANLHVAVVTVDTSGAPLAAGELYSYDLQFKVGSTTTTLKDEKLLEDEGPTSRIADVDPMAPLHLALGFEKDRLPSFLAPPATFAPTTPPTAAAGLRLAHASCRRPGSGAIDALGGLAALVADDATRPHQLHLTGDQIYADDVDHAVLHARRGARRRPGRRAVAARVPTRSAHRRLRTDTRDRRRRCRLGRQPAGDAPPVAALAARRVHRRRHREPPHHVPRVRRPPPPGVEPAGLAGDPDVRSSRSSRHPRRTRRDRPVAEPAVVLQRRASTPRQPEATLQQQWADHGDERRRASRASTEAPARSPATPAATPAVAQVLANTPTYMIFDDHEIADDWNLNGRWAARVYNREWGRFVVRNGLLAYALMQGWGNDPTHFTQGRRARPQAARRHPGCRQAGHGAHRDGDGRPRRPARLRPADRRRCRSGCGGTSRSRRSDHSVVVLDTRTHRDVNDLSLEAPNLVTNLDEQLPETAAHRHHDAAPGRRLAGARLRPVGHRAARPAAGPADHRPQERSPRRRGARASAPGDADDPQARRRLRRPRRAGRREVRPRGLVGQRGRVRGPARPPRQLPGRRAAVGRRPLRLHDGARLLGQGARATRRGSCSARRARPRTCSRRRSRRSPARTATSSGPWRCRSSASRGRRSTPTTSSRPAPGLPLARRARLRRKPALVPSAVWPKGTTIPRRQAARLAVADHAVVDTTTKRRGPARRDPPRRDRRDDRGEAGRRPVRRRGHRAPAARHGGQADAAAGRLRTRTSAPSSSSSTSTSPSPCTASTRATTSSSSMPSRRQPLPADRPHRAAARVRSRTPSTAPSSARRTAPRPRS